MYEKDKPANIKRAQESWEEKNIKQFENERKKEFLTESGIPLKRVYTPLDLADKGFDYLKDVNFPGEFPYVSGITPTMYRSQMWGITQYTGYPTPKESNEWWKIQIKAGAPFIVVAYDLPSQLGFDPDRALSQGEVGRVGVSMVSQKDWEVAFDGIDLGKVMVSQVYNAPAMVGVANYLCFAEKQGVNFNDLKGFCQNDILKEFIARGMFIFPPVPSIRLVVDLVSYCAKHVPQYLPLQVCSYHLSEKGANPVHEAAFSLSNAFAYFEAAQERGIDIDLFAPGIILLGTCNHAHFFEEIAKHRAMRKIYAEVLKERFKAKKSESQALKFFSGNGGVSLYQEQYLNNIVRNTVGALVGALSGIQYVNVRGYDEAFGIATNEALLTSIRTVQVVGYETGVMDVIDPLAGSYYVESLTKELEERIWKELKNIDDRGGALKCIETGYFQRKIAEDAYKWQKDFESGIKARVGVNCYRSEIEERPVKIYRCSPKVEEERISDIRELKRKRDNKKVKKAIDEIRATASAEATGSNNLMPPVMEAVKAYATTGEICDALREVWGEYTEISVF